MEEILHWFAANGLTLNSYKTKCIIFHPKQNHAGGDLIEQVESFEYLGLTMQENLHWDLHIDKISKKINRISGVIHRIGNAVDVSTLKAKPYLILRTCSKPYLIFISNMG